MQHLQGRVFRVDVIVLKNQPRGCLAVASRFSQPEIQSTLKFVYERKRAGKKKESRTGGGGGGGTDGGKRAETFRG